MKFNKDSHLWELVERKDMDDIRREEIPDFLFRLAEFITAQKFWQGTADRPTCRNEGIGNHFQCGDKAPCPFFG